MAAYIKREMRFFRNFYLCPDCPNEWSTEMAVIAADHCPCCDREAEPYDSEPLLEAIKLLVEREMQTPLDDPELSDITDTHSWPEAA